MAHPPDYPPSPADVAEAQRWDHTRLRRRLLYGLWQADARARQLAKLGDVRDDSVGDPDLSANPFRSICSGGAALYDRAPTIHHEDEVAEAALSRIVTAAGLWPQMQRTMRDTLGMREMLVAVDAKLQVEGDPASVVATYRPVYPDLVLATPDPEDPERPVEIREARQWTDRPTGRVVWVWDVWSLTGPVPTRRIYSAQANGLAGATLGADVSELVGLPAGGQSGDAYPCRGADGRPRLPYVVHHAARTGCLWDPYEGLEVVEGTLNVAVLWTLFGDFIRNASWQQRYTIGAEPAGSTQQGQRAEIPADPKFILQLAPMQDATNAIAGSWSVSSDPLAMAESIGLYERRLAAYAGIDPSDIQRVSGDPRSGYALGISREGKRESQRRFGPIFQPADVELLELTAIMVNAAAEAPLLPETGWEVTYQALPPSPEERTSEREHVLALLGAGLIDKPAAYMLLHPGTNREDALEATGSAVTEPSEDADNGR